VSRHLAVVQHHAAEGVGELGAWAQHRGVRLAIHRADRGELPDASFDRCVLLGGPCSVNAPPPWLLREKGWLREWIAAGRAVLGICLGSQLLAEALGARVVPLERPETGWARIDFADGHSMDVLQWHEDGFSLPPGATALARSAGCEGQLYRAGRHLGMQFHPEWNAGLVASLNAHFGAESPLPRTVDAARHEAVARWFHPELDAWWDG
jgi:GMP synthase (glutamine-hydrolysing)